MEAHTVNGSLRLTTTGRDTWHVDELFVNIQGRQQYLWRAVDQDGDVIDLLVQPTRDERAAERSFRKLLKRTRVRDRPLGQGHIIFGSTTHVQLQGKGAARPAGTGAGDRRQPV